MLSEKAIVPHVTELTNMSVPCPLLGYYSKERIELIIQFSWPP